MQYPNNRTFIMLRILVFLGLLDLPVIGVSAEIPKGVMKGAMHFSLAGDWLDSSLTAATGTGFFPLYLFYESLLKPMAGNMFTPCLAESWTFTPDYRVYEFKL